MANFENGNEVPFYEFQTFLDEQYPEKKYDIKIDNKVITAKDELKTIKVLSQMNTKNTEKALKSLDISKNEINNLTKEVLTMLLAISLDMIILSK